MQNNKLMLEYNLQFFAKDGPGGEKTEEPTAKKLEDARKEGQVAKSKEIGNAFSLLALFLMLELYLGVMGNQFLKGFHAVYNQIPDVIKMYNGNLPIASIHSLIRTMMLQLLIIITPILLVGFIVVFICDLVQVKWKLLFRFICLMKMMSILWHM